MYTHLYAYDWILETDQIVTGLFHACVSVSVCVRVCMRPQSY